MYDYLLKQHIATNNSMCYNGCQGQVCNHGRLGFIIYLTGGELKINYGSQQSCKSSTTNLWQMASKYFSTFLLEIFFLQASLTIYWHSLLFPGKKVKWSNHDLTILISF